MRFAGLMFIDEDELYLDFLLGKRRSKRFRDIPNVFARLTPHIYEQESFYGTRNGVILVGKVRETKKSK